MQKTVTIALALMLALAGSALADRASLSPTADAAIYQYAPTTNYGTNTRMEVGCWWTASARYEYRSFVQFDLSSIPTGSEIDACTLYVYGYYYQSPAGDYTASRVTGSWTESGVTWATQPAISNANEATINISAQGWRKFDVSAICRQWMAGTSNYGLRLWKNSLTDSVARTYFYTKEYTTNPTLRESLWVVYTPPGAAHITNIGRTPAYPLSTEGISVSAKIWIGTGPLDSALISYSNNRSTWAFARSDSNRAGDSMCFFHIPPRASGDSCHYRLHTWSGSVQTTTTISSFKIPRNTTVYAIQKCDTTVSSGTLWFDSLVHIAGIVSGVLTTNRVYVGPATGDTWGGLLVYGGSDAVLPGDSLDVVGSIYEFNNLTEVSPLLRMDHNGTSKAFETTNVTVRRARQEACEGVLVRLDSVHVLDSTGVGRVFNSGKTYKVANAGNLDTIDLYVTAGCAFVGTPIPPGEFSLVSNMSQFVQSHQLTPRYREDVIYIADLQALAVLAPPTLMGVGDTVSPRLVVRNTNATDTARSVSATFRIGSGYNVTRNIASFAPGRTDTIVFDRWTTSGGTWPVTASVYYYGDPNHANDSVKFDVTVRDGDVQMAQILAPAPALAAGDMVTPTVVVKNLDPTMAAANVHVVMQIGSVYNVSQDINRLVPGHTDTLTFSPWTATGGIHPVVASASAAFDPNRANDTLRATVTVTGSTIGTWVEKKPLPDAPSAKQVKDGGWLAYDLSRSVVYAAKGNKTPDFFAYSPARDSWQARLPWPGGAEAKQPGKGATACATGNGVIYATKGNNTTGFWEYDGAKDSWYQRQSVPLGLSNKRVKGGTDLAYASKGGKYYVYLLKGYRNEFYKYSPDNDSWYTLTPAPVGANLKWDNGSWLASDGINTIYAHKAKFHEFYAYNTATDSWQPAPLKAMPVAGRSGKARKAKDGACATWLNGHIYAFKGANTQELWRYFPVGDSWQEMDTIPAVGSSHTKKRIKSGADITAAGNFIYATKGNKCNELWKYTPFAPVLDPMPARDGALAARLPLGDFRLAIAPNPLSSGFATLSFAGAPRHPGTRPALLSIFDITGRCVRQSAIRNLQSAIALDLRAIPAGVYLVRVEADELTATRKLVVQR